MNASARPSVPDLSEPESADRFFLIARSAEAADGQPPFSDQSLVELRTGKRQPLVLDGVAIAIVAAHEAEFVVWPYARGVGYGTALLEAIIAGASGELLVWAHGDHPAARALARSHGLEPVRELLQLRAAVAEVGEVSTSSTSGSSEVSTSSTSETGSTSESSSTDISRFRPGVDDAAWLRVNARAFAYHPEQGSVNQGDLDELKSEPWFHAEDFLVTRSGGEISAYCWLKIEGETGEFYVVGVDPDRQGEGLGRRLMNAGFERLAERGIRTALLYVEADNAPALALYRSFGFETHSVDVQYRLVRA